MFALVVSAMAVAGVVGFPAAQAQPPVPGTPCSYTLSPPEVVNVDGADMVAATLTPAGCLGPFRPYLAVACVQKAGAPAQCTQARGTDPARVVTPYQPGATYISTGRGLGTLFNDMTDPNWQVLGPISATL